MLSNSKTLSILMLKQHSNKEVRLLELNTVIKGSVLLITILIVKRVMILQISNVQILLKISSLFQ